MFPKTLNIAIPARNEAEQLIKHSLVVHLKML